MCQPQLTTDDPSAVPDVPAGRAQLDDLDRQIRALLRRRVAVSGRVQSLRQEQGGQRIQHVRENEVVSRYVDELGEPGLDIALAVLQLCRGRLGHAPNAGGGSGI